MIINDIQKAQLKSARNRVKTAEQLLNNEKKLLTEILRAMTGEVDFTGFKINEETNELILKHNEKEEVK